MKTFPRPQVFFEELCKKWSDYVEKVLRAFGEPNGIDVCSFLPFRVACTELFTAICLLRRTQRSTSWGPPPHFGVQCNIVTGRRHRSDGQHGISLDRSPEVRFEVGNVVTEGDEITSEARHVPHVVSRVASPGMIESMCGLAYGLMLWVRSKIRMPRFVDWKHFSSRRVRFCTSKNLRWVCNCFISG